MTTHISHQSLTLRAAAVLIVIFALGAFAAAPASAGDPSVCYVVADSGGANGGNDLLFSVNKASGGQTTIGTGTGTNNVEANVFDPWNNRLLAADASILGTVSLSSGVFSSAGFSPFGSGAGSAGTIAFNDVDGLAFDPFTGFLYGMHRRNGAGVGDILFRINPSSGVRVAGAFGGNDYVVVPPTSGRADIDDMGISAVDGQMYGIANGGGSDLLVAINKATGAASSVGSLGVSDMEGLNFDSQGVLWGVRGTPSFSLFRVNTGSGAAAAVHPLSNGGDHEAIACLTGAPNTILGTVYLDQNGDALEDAGEPGTAGVTVTLYRDTNGNGIVDAGDTPVDATTTDSGGNYSFNFSATGVFVVDIDTNDLPFGHSLSTDNVEAADFGSSFGVTDADNDFGWIVPANLGDLVWEDLNGDGIQDAGEPGIGGVTVNLLDSGGATVGTTTTAADGSYLFAGINAGDYTIEVVEPAGMNATLQDQGSDSSDSDIDPTTGQTGAIAVMWGDNNLTVDAGLYFPASLGDFVWDDLNFDGVQDAGEPGIGGLTVTLLDAGGTPIGTTVTAADGSYSFTGLAPGDYQVGFEDPVGLAFTGQDQGGDDAVDSDADVTTGLTAIINLTSGEFDATIDVGYVPAASLGDFVWEDLDGDGIQDAGEPGVGGVTVNLLDDAGTLVATTLTAADGSYDFSDLAPDDYEIEFGAPAGFLFSLQDQGANDAADSDADRVTGRTGVTSLSPGENDVSVDAGLIQEASLGEFVWDDLDADGIQDAGEPGIGGVTVNLLDDGGNVIATTTSAADGSYPFGMLFPGTYQVGFVAPAGYSASPSDQGGDDSVDSDAAAGGLSPLVALSSGENDTTLDAGFYLPASLGDFVWEDLNANGIQDAGEPGIGGVTVNLLDGGGNFVSSTATAADGSYLFSGLAPGAYQVVVAAPAGAVVTAADQGGDDSADSDIDAAGLAPVLNLVSGESNRSVDAGVYFLASVGDVAWNDLNFDGIRDAGEPGIPGLTVTLFDALGVPIATTTSAGDGSYSFTGLTPGDYSVGFEDPVGSAFTLQDQGGDNAVDSDVDVTSGITAPVTLTSGEFDATVDAGYVPAASIGDFVWEDLNGNGVQDSGEPGVGGVFVNLLDTAGNVITTTTTAADGSYAFGDLAPGDYQVQFLAPIGTTLTTRDAGTDDAVDSDADPATGTTALVSLTPGETNNTIDAGIFAAASLGDFVWDDLNADGIQDAGEPGLGGVTVNLLDGAGNVIASTTTAADGSYLFSGLAPGDYQVGFVAPAGAVASPADQGGDDATDSDAVGGFSPVVSLVSGDSDVSIDAGFYTPASLGDLVWDDLNGNGIQDAGESGIGGVIVNLLDGLGNVVATTATAADGSYLFFGLVPGDYLVTVVAPAGAVITATDQGGDDTLDSDISASGMSPVLTLISGENNLTVDAGVYFPASIGDFVWDDLNANGIQDAGEPGVGGVTVNLLDGTGTVVATATTAADGSYLFSGLAPGDYQVEVVPPAVYSISVSDAGADDTLDSDIHPTTGISPAVTVGSGDAEDSIDAGLVLGSSIGDLVWDDLNGNGIQDAGEPGILGVIVNLIDGASNVIDSTSTAADGSYSFDGLPPGDYQVQFVAPVGTIVTAQEVGGDDGVDSDAGTAGFSPVVTVTAGDENTTIDAGFYTPGSLGDFVWDDLNGDGVQDAGEAGIGGVTVNLLDGAGNLVGSTTTAADGSYLFAGLTPGDYQVEIVAPAGMLFSPSDQDGDSTDSDFDASGFSGPVGIVSGDADLTIDGGLYAPASVGDLVWDDLNGNGIQDAGEPGVAGVTVNLLDVFGAPVDTTTTAADGTYLFSGLAPGDYTVEVVAPPGETFSPAGQGGDAAGDSDVDPGGLAPVSVTSGDVVTTVDAGLYTGAQIGDLVWSDLDGDGLQDLGEPGVEGVTVLLIDEDGSVVASTVTGPDGSYLFDGVLPGTYTVAVDPLSVPNDLQAPPNQVVTVDAGDDIETVDFPLMSLLAPANEPPVFADIVSNDLQTIPVGGAPVPIVGSDPDSDPIEFDLLIGELPPGLTLNPDGTFSGVATQSGTYTVTIRVCDTGGLCTIQTLTVVVQQTLPMTGLESGTAGVAAILWILIGMVLVLVARRRRGAGDTR